MFRTILVHVDNEPGAAERTRCAVDLAKRFDATLLGLTAGLPQLPMELYADAIGSVAIGPDYSDFDRKHVHAEFGKTAAAFKAWTDHSGLETDWRAVFESPSIAIIRAATAADLIVLGVGDHSLIGNYNAPSAGDVVLRTGRPVLVVPEGQNGMNVRNVVIAWKETAEAQRAIADAIPFMKGANSVTIVQIHENGPRAPSLADPEAFLVRHGIAAKTALLPRGEAAVGDQIAAFAKKTDADLIVAGAYGHTRLREWVFGGVTRGLLINSPIPCLFSH
jgi:nucleotide-binding universal stress UspA family protein